jgi:hypothetical protein
MNKTKYDEDNSYLWLLIFCFVMFWFMTWADSRPTHFKPRRSSHVTSYQR